jgi:hypothetical protein
VETTTPFLEGTKVRLRISHHGANFFAHGNVAYSRPDAGMGIAFTLVEPSALSILEDWLAELRK